LLRLTVVGDNAAMDAAPPKASLAKRIRRWFPFRRPTLFGIIALVLVAWYGNQIRWTVNRQAVRREIATAHGSKVYFFPGREPPGLMLALDLISDEPVEAVSVSPGTKLTTDEKLLIEEWFPEARIE
jgi:hypothetical protein